ncbi:MAG: hypothetical protein IJS32_10185 [Kiritimatiellae bacterium]|nr:hypothetical protein [Kiritimatiellia bacterium]
MGTDFCKRLAVALLAAGALAACSRAPAPEEIEVAGWRLSVVLPAGADAASARKVVSLAARAACATVPEAGEGTARIVFGKDLGILPHWAAPRPVAVQEGDEIRVGYRTDDPAATANRLAHELAHWRLEKLCGGRTALWLDEGLAQVAGRTAANEAARCFSLDVSERLSLPWKQGVAALVAATAYPAGRDESGAFYAASLRLADAFLARHGLDDCLALAKELAAAPAAETFFAFCAARYCESADEIAAWLSAAPR